MTRTVLILGVLIAAQGCRTGDHDSPVSREALPAVMLDVYLAEAAARRDSTSLEVARVDALSRHGLDTSAYHEALRVLTQDPQLGKDVFQALLDSVVMEQRDIRARMLEDSVSSGS
jgi:hypothetical protein